jgi:hypothetical protein
MTVRFCGGPGKCLRRKSCDWRFCSKDFRPRSTPGNARNSHPPAAARNEAASPAPLQNPTIQTPGFSRSPWSDELRESSSNSYRDRQVDPPPSKCEWALTCRFVNDLNRRGYDVHKREFRSDFLNFRSIILNGGSDFVQVFWARSKRIGSEISIGLKPEISRARRFFGGELDGILNQGWKGIGMDSDRSKLEFGSLAGRNEHEFNCKLRDCCRQHYAQSSVDLKSWSEVGNFTSAGDPVIQISANSEQVYFRALIK